MFVGSFVGDCGGGEPAAEDAAFASDGVNVVGFCAGAAAGADSGAWVCAIAWEATASDKAISENLGKRPFILKAG